jgi:tetratricopeptide (TPR) repeat protein
MAEVTINRLDGASQALTILGDALRDDPSNDEVLNHIHSIAGDKRLWSTAYEIVAPVADAAADSNTSMKLHLFAGKLAAGPLSNPTLAARHFTVYLSMNSDDLEVLGKLEDAYIQLNRKEDQARILRRRIGLAGDDAGADMRLRLASVLIEDATDVEGAFEQVRTVLVNDPANAEAIRLMSNLSAEPIVGRHAMDALRRAFTDSKDDTGLLWAVEAQIERSHETSDLLELHNQAAAAAARLGKAHLELTHLGKALSLDPSDDNLLDRILAAAASSRDGKLAWNVLRMAAQAASWPDLEKKLLLTGVKLAADLGHESPAEIETALRRVMEIDPSSREALEALDNEYSMAGRIEDLIKVLRHRLRLDLGVSERIDVLIRIAGLLETRREFKAAAEAFEEASSLGAGDLDTLKRLRKCYEQTDDVQGQVDTIERLSSATPDVAGRLALLLEAAGLQETVLHDLPAARATLERVVSLDPIGTAARRRLESIYEQLEEYEPLVRILGYAIDSDLPLDERVRSALKATSIAENRLENMGVALGFARKAAQIDPGAPTVIDELLRLYYKSEDWTSLISIIRRKAQNEADSTEKVLLLARACDIARDKLGDHALAGTIAREIIAVNPNHPEALLTLARMMESKDQDTEALKLFRRLQEAAIDENHRIDALLGTARILMKRGESGEEVRTALQEAAAINPKHPAVNEFLKKVYSERGDFAKVVEVLLRDLKNAESDEDRAGICMDIAETYLKKLNQGDKFIQYAEEAHRYRKDDPRVVAGIVKFYLKTGDEQKAVPYLEWLVNYLEAKRRLRELPPYAHELGRILEAAGDLTRAVEYYRICHEHDASNINNTLALARLHVRNRDMEKAMRVLQPLLLRIDALEPEQKKEVLLSIAGIHESRGDMKKARQFVTRLLSDQPDCREAREALSRL